MIEYFEFEANYPEQVDIAVYHCSQTFWFQRLIGGLTNKWSRTV